MNISRAIIPTTIAFISCLVIAFILSDADSGSKKIEKELHKHGFSNSLIIEAIPEMSSVSGMAASAMIANAPDYREGPTAILTRASVDKIKALNGVLGLYTVSSSIWKLQTSKRSANVTVYGVTPEFLESYNLIDKRSDISSQRSRNFLIGKSLATQLSIDKKQQAELTLTDETLKRMPPQMLEKADWSAIKQSINVAPALLSLPQGIPSFENSLFTTGPISKVTIGNMHILPNVRIFAVVENENSLSKVIELAPRLSAAQAGYVIKIKRFSDNFAADISRQTFQSWKLFYLCTAIAILASTIFIIVISRVKQTKDEVALRLSFGASKSKAIWFSIKEIYFHILVGALPGLLLGFLLSFKNYPSVDIKSVLIFAFVFFSCIGINIAIVAKSDMYRMYRSEELG